MDALLLDLDGTLLDDRAAVGAAFAEFLRANGCESQDRRDPDTLTRWRELAAVHSSRFERGEVTFEEQRRARVREFLGADMSDAEADTAFEPYRRHTKTAGGHSPNAPDSSSSLHMPKVVVTNGNRAQQLLKIKRCGLAQHLHAVVTAEDCGAWKPDPRMFLAALAQLRLPPARCMVGDDAARDIQPARALGLRTHLVDRSDPSASLLQALDAI